MGKKLRLLLVALTLQTLNASTIQWSNPSTISTSLVNASDPQVVIDNNGNTTAAWIENNFVKVSSLPHNGTWSALQTLSQTGASSPKLGVDSSGNVTAIWLENGVVTAATLPYQGSWGSATAISQSGAASEKLAVDSTGNAVAAWERGGFIESATKLANGSWGSVSVLSAIGSESNPDVAIGENGLVVAVWHTITSSDTIYAATSQINGSWNTSAAVLPADAQLHYNYPTVTIDPFGNTYAAWFSHDLSGSDYFNVSVMTESLLAGDTNWSDLTILDQAGRLNPQNLMIKLQCDNHGNVIALWTQSPDGDTFNIQTATQLYRNTWVTGGSLSLSNIYGFTGDISCTPLGHTVAAYMYFDGSSIVIQSTETNILSEIQDFWSIPQNVSQQTNNGYPRTAYSSDGTTLYASTVWIQFNGSNNIIQAVTGSKTPVAPPTNLSVIQQSTNYGIFQDYYNTLNWSASTEPNVYLYAIYRNNIFNTSVDANTLQFVDHNEIQNASVTYGVATINANNECSSVSTISFP